MGFFSSDDSDDAAGCPPALRSSINLSIEVQRQFEYRKMVLYPTVIQLDLLLHHQILS